MQFQHKRHSCVISERLANHAPTTDNRICLSQKGSPYPCRGYQQPLQDPLMRYLCSTFGVSFSHASPVHTLRRQHYHISMLDLLRAIYRAQSSKSTQVWAGESATRPKELSYAAHMCIQLLVVDKVGCIAHTDAHLHDTQSRTATTQAQESGGGFTTSLPQSCANGANPVMLHDSCMTPT